MGQAAARGGPQGLLVLANVVLVYPNTGLDVRGVSVWLPLAVLQVAATIHRDYDVAIVDQRLPDGNWRRSTARDYALKPVRAVEGPRTNRQQQGSFVGWALPTKTKAEWWAVPTLRKLAQ